MNSPERIFTALQRKSPDRVPVMEIAIDWKVIKDLGYKSYFDAIDHPIKDESDLRGYKPPDPSRDILLKAVKKVARRYKGKRVILCLGRTVFADSWTMCGMENLLMSYALNPRFAKDIEKIVLEYNKELHRLAIDAGVDVFVLGDDYAHKLGTMMSPDHFREFILPGLSETVENIKSAGAYCIKHTDGNTITSAVRGENFSAMLETCREFGSYPIAVA